MFLVINYFLDFMNFFTPPQYFRTNTALSSFLRAHREENFLKPHGGSVERYLGYLILDYFTAVFCMLLLVAIFLTYAEELY